MLTWPQGLAALADQLERTSTWRPWSGAVVAWLQEPGLGYVVSTHRDIRMSRPERSAFTAITQDF